MIDKAPSKNLVDIPTTALTHIQKMAPGPPTVMAIATPAMLPMPTVEAMALISACAELICPSAVEELLWRSAFIALPRQRNDTQPE